MKRSIKHILISVMLSIATCAAPIAHADEDSEREALAKIAMELQKLEKDAHEAGRNATSAPRIRFRYDWLARDLALVRSGIETHLDAPRQPRPVPPLKGDYRD